MDASKDHYALLGVLPSIEQSALVAVYRALLKKYHPDVYSGPKSDAERITKELNEAFSVLGNAEKRNEYDIARKTRNTSSEDYGHQQDWDASKETDIEAEVNKDWEYVVRYRPNLEGSRQDLESVSASLAFAFQVTVLETKSWDDATQVAKALEHQFLERYFGTSPAIHTYVLKAFKAGRRDVALEVNQAIKILGTPSDSQVLDFLRTVGKTTSWYVGGHQVGVCPSCNRLRDVDLLPCAHCGSTKPTISG